MLKVNCIDIVMTSLDKGLFAEAQDKARTIAVSVNDDDIPVPGRAV